MKRLKKQGLKALVLDLRFNPGGLLDSAVNISDMFIDDGLIVSIKPRVGQDDPYTGRHEESLLDFPMVCLVNGGSASGSEIVSACLQDHKRAIVMGTPTFGKGSVQTILPLGNNTAIKLTTARYYTPNGRSIQAKGISPDIVVEDPANKELEARVREADLLGHLMNDREKEIAGKPVITPPKTNGNGTLQPLPETNGATSDPNVPADPAEVVSKNDFQVNQAINLLKGLQIVNTKNNSN